MKTCVFDFIQPENSSLKVLANRFINGFSHAKSEITHLNFFSMNIEDCRACTSNIFFLQDGNCKCQDDLTNYYPQIFNSNNLVFIIDSENVNTLQSFMNILNRFEPVFPIHLDGDSKKEKLKNVVGVHFNPNVDLRYHHFIVNTLDEFSLLFRYRFFGVIQIPNVKILKTFSEDSLNKLGIFEDLEKIGYELATNKIITKEVVERLENLSYIDEKIENYISRLKNLFSH